MTQSVFTKKYDQFRRQLVEARQSAGLTQQAVAQRVSRPQSYVSKYERGERRLDVVEFLEIAKAIGVDVNEFLARLSGDSLGRGRTTKKKGGRRRSGPKR